MNPIEFIRKNITDTLKKEGYPEDVIRGGQKRVWISTAACPRPARKATASTIALRKRASIADFTPRKVPKEDQMENEIIVPFEMTCRDSHGKLIHVVGVEQVKNWVLFHRPGYEHGLCFCPRRDFGTKFKKVSA